MNTDDELDKIFLNFAVTMERVVDVDTGRKLAGARGGLLHTLQVRVDQQKQQIKESTLNDIYKPFKPGLWYALKECHLDCVYPIRWHRAVFQKGDHILVLRCAGWNRGIGSWWWIVDKEGMKLKVLWRYQPPFKFDWEFECPLPSE